MSRVAIHLRATDRVQVIDTHTHFHDPAGSDDLLWPKPDAPYYRTCLPQNYRAEIGARPVVMVETSPRPKDDVRLMALAAQDPLILGYVSNLQPLEAGFDQRLAQAIADPKWRGIRLRPIAHFDLTAPPLISALDRLDGHGHVELGVAHPDKLAVLRTLCLALPHIRFVVTHCGHPSLDAGARMYDYSQFAGLDNLYLKLSPPRIDPADRAYAQDKLAQHVGRLIAVLSSQKLMFGSNWPVAEDPLGFQSWLADTLAATGGDVAQVFAHTARKIYGPVAQDTAGAAS